MLHQNAPALNTEAVNKVLTTLKCASKYNIKHNNILTIIDFSLPSSAKRLWVFDLAKNKLLFHTHVSHGIKSGSLLSNYFSNKVNSKASSIGVYNTEKAYFGRHGLSLKLYGLDKVEKQQHALTHLFQSLQNKLEQKNVSRIAQELDYLDQELRSYCSENKIDYAEFILSEDVQAGQSHYKNFLTASY